MIVLSVIGTRPEAIKMAPVIAELERHPKEIRSLVCVTGQHREMVDPLLEFFGVEPDFELDVMRPGLSLARTTAALIERLDRVIEDTRPDWVLAQGDTTSVLAASLVSFQRRVRFGHVEAGLRTGDMARPFPEEMHRRVADLVADARFVPTERARQQLIDERCNPATIHVTGNTVVDALMDVVIRPFDWEESRFHQLIGDKRLVLVTAHRRESFGELFRQICEAIRELATQSVGDPIQIVFPVHLNPNVQTPVREILDGLASVSLVEPVDYLTMLQLMKRAALVLTDSGGIQEEAPSLGVPVLVMRETTERPEGLDTGLIQMVGVDRGRIVSAARMILKAPASSRSEGLCPSPYGDGKAAARIVATLLRGG